MNKPKFSVALIARNEAVTLPRLIGSLKEFQDQGGDIWVLDTGSTDNTVEVARDLGRDSIGIEINPDYVEIAKAVLTHDKKGNRNLHPEPEVIK